MVRCMVLEGLYLIWFSVWYWGNCIANGLLYGSGGIVLDMVRCMVRGDCIGYSQMYGTGGIVLDMV
jgi:hypothetical protein